MTLDELIKTLYRFTKNGKELRVEIETESDTYENFTIEEAFGTLIIKTF